MADIGGLSNTIPLAALNYYKKELEMLEQDAREKLLRVLKRMDWTSLTLAECRDLVIQAAQMVLGSHTQLAAQASSEFYAAVREMEVGGPLYETVNVAGYNAASTDRAVRYFAQGIVDAIGNDPLLSAAVLHFNAQVLGHVCDQIHRAAQNNMLENGKRDPRRPRFARVPMPGACAFCIMLGSRGFVYLSREKAGDRTLNSFHDNCRCQIVPGWDLVEMKNNRRIERKPSVAGYDPQALYEQYKILYGVS